MRLGYFGRGGLVAVIALAAVVLFASLPVQAQDEEGDTEIEAAVDEVVAAFNAGDIDAFAALFTDEGLIGFVDDSSVTTADEARDAISQFIGTAPVEVVEVRDIQVNGDTASAIAELSIGGSISIDRLEFSRIDGAWIVSGYTSGVEQPPAPEIPEGAETVHVNMFEYAFEFDASGIDVGDDIAFEAENTGEEPHELVVAKVPEDLDLEEAFSSPGPPPAGVEDITFTFAEPGETGVALAESLDAGRYVFVCFVETEEGVPHVALGMWDEFNLGAAAAPTTPTVEPEPPATGSGSGGSASSTTVFIGLGLGLVALAFGAAFTSRRIAARVN